MAKDPAVLWYFNDWHGGTVTFSRFLKGCYMDLLYAQFNNGHLSLDEVKTVLGSDFGSAWPTLQKKFKQDDNGLFFNERLVFESTKRKSFSESRRKNLKGSPPMDDHMENTNEIEDRRLKFESEVKTFEGEYGETLIQAFVLYWTESNGKKMRYEMEKTFEISKRLITWKKNDLNWNKNANTKNGYTGSNSGSGKKPNAGTTIIGHKDYSKR